MSIEKLTVRQFFARFPDDDACLNHVMEVRHGLRHVCRACGEDFASQMHVDDLKVVLDQLSFDYRFATARGKVHYQDICPACRRRLLALNQGRSIGR